MTRGGVQQSVCGILVNFAAPVVWFYLFEHLFQAKSDQAQVNKTRQE